MVIRQMEIGKKRTAGERVSAAAGIAHRLIFHPSANGPPHGTPNPLAPDHFAVIGSAARMAG
jgi:hypothetical protein